MPGFWPTPRPRRAADGAPEPEQRVAEHGLRRAVERHDDVHGLPVQQADAPTEPSGSAGVLLSRRESSILELIVRGCTNREIAASLGIAEQTVKNHVHRIYAKLGLDSRVELLIWDRERVRPPHDRGVE